MTAAPKSRRRLALCLLLLATLILGACTSAGSGPRATPAASEPLASWHDTDAKGAILGYVDAVTRPGSADFIPPEHRVATFDFDGTVGCEKPDYIEVVVAMTRLCELTKSQPELLEDELYRAACDGDRKTIDARVQDALLKAFEGEAQSFYVDYVENFLRTREHPRFDRPYAELYYQPMLELIEFLHDHAFAVHIVSGSQQGFTRGFGGRILGLPSSRLIGNTVQLDFTPSDAAVEGAARLLRQAAFLEPSVDGEGKAEIIRNRIGQPPVLAFGNSMGDFEMLQYATSGDYRGLALILVHDDPEEYVYGSPRLEQHAEELGWQIVGMKESFEVLFPD